MTSIRKFLLAASILLATACALPIAGGVPAAFASDIKYVVNGQAITSLDIQHRMAFLKLQHRPGSAKTAADEMIEQVLKEGELQRLHIVITDATVNDSFAHFAGSNHLTAKQMSQILDRAGVTTQHFKDYMRTQMGWNQALGARYRAQGGTMSEQDVVQRMLQNGGSKPTATEYMLQQIIFVVPASERKATLAKRRKEAEAMRARFSGCDSTRQFAKGLIDVTVKDLGRFLAPELPPEWAPLIKNTKTGGATTLRETERGVEFLGICSAREVSDDRVAKMVFQSEGNKDQQADEMSKKYLAELRQRARIVER